MTSAQASAGLARLFTGPSTTLAQGLPQPPRVASPGASTDSSTGVHGWALTGEEVGPYGARTTRPPRSGAARKGKASGTSPGVSALGADSRGSASLAP